jgi:hypothetical protein
MPSDPQEVTASEICDAIAETLEAASEIKLARSIDEIRERVAATDCQMLEVYPDKYFPNANDETDRKTFRGGLRKSKWVIHVNHYPRPLSHIGEDMQALVEGLDSLSAVLESQENRPFFGSDVIDSFSWHWQRVTLIRSDGRYRGGRFIIEVYVL